MGILRIRIESEADQEKRSAPTHAPEKALGNAQRETLSARPDAGRTSNAVLFVEVPSFSLDSSRSYAEL